MNNIYNNWVKEQSFCNMDGTVVHIAFRSIVMILYIHNDGKRICYKTWLYNMENTKHISRLSRANFLLLLLRRHVGLGRIII